MASRPRRTPTPATANSLVPATSTKSAIGRPAVRMAKAGTTNTTARRRRPRTRTSSGPAGWPGSRGSIPREQGLVPPFTRVSRLRPALRPGTRGSGPGHLSPTAPRPAFARRRGRRGGDKAEGRRPRYGNSSDVRGESEARRAVLSRRSTRLGQDKGGVGAEPDLAGAAEPVSGARQRPGVVARLPAEIRAVALPVAGEADPPRPAVRQAEAVAGVGARGRLGGHDDAVARPARGPFGSVAAAVWPRAFEGGLRTRRRSARLRRPGCRRSRG